MEIKWIEKELPMDWGLDLGSWSNASDDIEQEGKKKSKAKTNKCPECGHEF